MYIFTALKYKFMVAESRRYGRENLDPAVWGTIDRSYRRASRVIWTAALILVIMLIYSAIQSCGAATAVFRSREETRPGHLKGGRIWYVYGGRHEVDAEDYGIDPSDYRDGAQFSVTVADDGYAVGIEPEGGQESAVAFWSADILVKSAAWLFCLAVIRCIAKHTFGRAWYAYHTWWCRGCEGPLSIG